MTPVERLIGEGTLSAGGGCLVAQSLKVRLTPLEQGAAVEIEDRWHGLGQRRGVTHGTIDGETLAALVAELRPLLEAPRVPPTMASSAYGAGVCLPLDGGVLEGGGSEMTEGPPVGPLIDAVLAFTEQVQAAPASTTVSFEGEPLTGMPAPAPGLTRRSGATWLVLVGLALALLLVSIAWMLTSA